MTVLDAGILAVLTFFIAWGAWVGLIRQLALVLALILAFVGAGLYAGEVHDLAAAVLPSPRWSFILSYLLLAGIVYLAIRILALGLRRVVNLSFTPWFDRVLGGAFGGFKAYLLLVLCYLVLIGLNTPFTPLLQKSWSNPYLATGADCLRWLVRDEATRKFFSRREPAISAIFPIPGPPPE